MILTFSFWNLLCVRSFICDAIFVYSFVGLLIEHYNWSCVEIWFTLQHKTPNTNWFAAHSCCVTPSMFFSNPFRFPLFFLPSTKAFCKLIIYASLWRVYSLVSHFSFSLSLHLCVHPIYLFVLRILIVCLLICFSVSLSQFLGFVCTRICACLRYTFSQLFTLDMYLLRPYILIWRKTDRRHSLPVFRLVEILLMIFFPPAFSFPSPKCNYIETWNFVGVSRANSISSHARSKVLLMGEGVVVGWDFFELGRMCRDFHCAHYLLTSVM